MAKFREFFRDHSGQYVLIGGAACELRMDEAGLTFRATRDLDIVLCVEALDVSFVKVFWEFIREGKYQVQQTSTGEPRYYRFQKPAPKEALAEFSHMLKLFFRQRNSPIQTLSFSGPPSPISTV